MNSNPRLLRSIASDPSGTGDASRDPADIRGAFQDRTLRPYFTLIAASVLLPLLIFGFAAWQNWRHLEWLAEGRAERRAALVAEHALKVFQGNEQVLRRIEDRVRGLSWDEVARSPEISTFLTALPQEIDHLQGAGLIAPDGRLAAVSEIFPAPQINLSDRDYVQAARNVPGSTQISAPTTGRISGQSFFRLSRQRTGPAGPDGIIFVSVSPEYFNRFYSTITGGEDAVTMIRADGAVLAREPPVTTRTEVLSPRSGLMQGITKAERGIYRTVSELDRVERIYAYQRITGYPVYVSYGFSLKAVEREWRANLLTFGAVTALAALALLLLSLLALRQARQERRIFADYVAEVRLREETEARLRQSQKMEAVGQLTGGVAHDFNNLLTVVIGSLGMLQRRLVDGQPRDLRLVENALEGARRAASLTHRLLAFSRQQPLDPKPIAANSLVSGMSDLLQRTLGETIEIETVLAAGLWRIHIDPNELENAILNLAVNARDAMPDGGKLTIETANAALDEVYAASRPAVRVGQYVMVCVSDTGSGMRKEVMERVFEPFFTTKPVGKGTGLGLSQVYGFIRQSGGHVALYSEPGEGTTVKLYLPRHSGEEKAAAPDAERIEAPVRSRSGEKVLVVEDDAMVRRFSVEALGEAGYNVVEAADGAAGLAMLDRHSDVALLFTDVVLAGPMNGRRLADAALTRRPDLKVLFTTGYTRNAIIHQGRLDPGVQLLTKPFTARELTQKVRAVLDATGEAVV